MKNTEAKSVLDATLAEYRKRPYQALVSLISEPETCDATGPSGKTYQVEILAVWDDRRAGNLRVIGSIDDGTLTGACVPLGNADFIIAPDGTFVGEVKS